MYIIYIVLYVQDIKKASKQQHRLEYTLPGRINQARAGI
jgi:hypothetical protein